MLVLRIQDLISLRALTGGVLCLALLTAGCERKTTRPTPPVLVPSIEVPQPVPPSQPPDENTNAAPQTAPAEVSPHDEQRPKPKPRKPIIHRAPQQPAPPEAPRPEFSKPIAPDPSVQITADVPRAAVQSQKQNTEQLLRSSDGKLSHINHSLSESEQGMLRQARNYIIQSNQALQGGDIERAYNLAVKASLLANELAK